MGSKPKAGAGGAGAPLEIELKLRLREQDAGPLSLRLDRLAASQTLQVDSTYHDTPDGRLAAGRAALRVRALVVAGRRRWVQTLKTGDDAAALSRRGEWETAAPRGRLDPARMADTPLGELLRGCPLDGPQGLHPVFRTRFERRRWLLEQGGARIEVALDRGEILAGRRRESICELELELLAGPPAAAWSLALHLAAPDSPAGGGLALLPYGDSKAARGYRLAGGLPPPVAQFRLADLALRPRTAAAQAARAVVGQGTQVMLANAGSAGEPDSVEHVHQARVALRRMRSALRLLRREAALPDELATGLRRVSVHFGAVRDGDVLVQETLPALVSATAPAVAPSWPALLAAVGQRRQLARERLLAELATPAFARLCLQLLQWAGETPAGEATPTLRQFAPAAAQAGYERLLDAGRFFSALSTPRRHRVRILAKRLRYNLELLAPALPRGALKSCLPCLARLQQVAGEANDAAAALLAVQSLSPVPALRAGVADWAEARERAAIVQVERCLDELQALRLRFD